VSTAFLSEAWFEALTRAAEAGPRYDGPPSVVEVRVAGGESGAVAYHVVLEPGAPLRYVAGPAPAEADASYDQAWADALAQATGRYDPAVGFMQGNLKVKGSSRPLFELFRLWADPATREALARVGPDAGLAG
jgi:hypothetical protein